MTSIRKPVNGKLLVKQETHSHIREKGRERKKRNTAKFIFLKQQIEHQTEVQKRDAREEVRKLSVWVENLFNLTASFSAIVHHVYPQILRLI